MTPRKSNQLPPPKAEQTLYQGHRIIETVFSSLDRFGLSDRPYRSNVGLVLHVYTTILAYQLKQAIALIFLSRIGVLYMFLTLAFAWLSAALARGISSVVDKNHDTKNLGGILFEAVIGLLFPATLLPES